MNIDCYEDNGRSYEGTVRKTRSGYECQYWNRTDNYNKEGTHNYCRNTEAGGAPWCYTVDNDVIWETCDVKICCHKSKNQQSNVPIYYVQLIFSNIRS